MVDKLLQEHAPCPVNEENEPAHMPDLADVISFLESGTQAVELSLQFMHATAQPDGRLDLCKQGIGAHGMSQLGTALAANTFVKHILVGTNWLMSAGAATIGNVIAANNALQTVYLGCNYIDSEGIGALCQGLMANESVNALWLKRNPIGEEGVGHLCRMLRQRGGIRLLDLAGTGIKGALPQLVEALLTERGRQVEYLYLGENGFTPDEMPCLAALLKESALKGLFLNSNRLADDGTATLVQALRNNRHLQFLALASNGIGPPGAREIAAMLPDHVKLAVLESGRAPSTYACNAVANSIADEGAECLADAFANNGSLRSCNLSHNEISDRGALAILGGLENNQTMQTLMLGRSVSRKVREAIYERLKRNCVEQEPTSVPFSKHIHSVYRTVR